MGYKRVVPANANDLAGIGSYGCHWMICARTRYGSRKNGKLEHILYRKRGQHLLMMERGEKGGVLFVKS